MVTASSFPELGLLLAGLGVLAVLATISFQENKIKLVGAALLWVAIFGFSQPATAAAVNDNVLSKPQAELNETLKTTPNGNQYQGIEYADTKGSPLSDREITRKIDNTAPDSLKISVANGSVRLSGKMSDRGTAQSLIQTIKEIPGVHEISYDIGLENLAS
jgi:hypothetical protein